MSTMNTGCQSAFPVIDWAIVLAGRLHRGGKARCVRIKPLGISGLMHFRSTLFLTGPICVPARMWQWSGVNHIAMDFGAFGESHYHAASVAAKMRFHSRHKQLCSRRMHRHQWRDFIVMIF